jgi:hypothetical protein
MNILMILCFSFNFIKNEKIIYTNFINGLKGYYVEYKIGNKNFIIKKYINLQNSYTLIPNSLFNSNYSSSLKIINYNKEIKLNNYKTNVSVLEDFLYLNNNIKIPFTFYSIPSVLNYNPLNEGFNFGYKTKNENFSIIHLLKKYKYIDSLKFGFYHKVMTNNSTLYFGGFPENLNLEKYNQNLKCKINTKKNLWGCFLAYIMIENQNNINQQNLKNKYIYYNKKINKYYSFYNPEINGINVPSSFYHFLLINIFSQYFNSKQCQFDIISNEKILSCKTDVIDYIKPLIFCFEEKCIKLNFTYLFENKGEYSNLNIKINKYFKDYNDNENNFGFGRAFLDQFHSLFSYENNYIQFYSRRNETIFDSNLFYLKKTNKFLALKIFIYIFLIIFLIILYIFFLKYKYERKKNFYVKIQNNNNNKNK